MIWNQVSRIRRIFFFLNFFLFYHFDKPCFEKAVNEALNLYEHLLSASSRDELKALHNGNHSASLCVCTLDACDSEWVTVALHSAFSISTEVMKALFSYYMAARATAAVSAQVLCTPYNHATVYSVTPFNHRCRVHVCLAVTCYLRFWQNDRGPLRATAVTRRWNGYRNKSQLRKLALETTTESPAL